MPKRIIAQRRGKGSPTFRAPSHRFHAKLSLPPLDWGPLEGVITDIFHDPGHTAPVMEVRWSNGEVTYMAAPLGVKVGDKIKVGEDAELKPGNILPLGSIPEGSDIYMIEIRPGDGGKLVRAAGTSAKVLSKYGDKVLVQLPSRAIKELSARCRAVVGIIAGGGRKEKPIAKAGKKYYIMRARNRYWPYVRRNKMNPCDHPWGGGSGGVNWPKTTPKNAPPGQKVGSFGARRTGRRKGSKKGGQ